MIFLRYTATNFRDVPYCMVHANLMFQFLTRHARKLHSTLSAKGQDCTSSGRPTSVPSRAQVVVCGGGVGGSLCGLPLA